MASDQNNQTNPDWSFKNDHDLLVACVGYSFGPNPEQKMDDVRRIRGEYGYVVHKRMSLTQEDVVLDIGSGCGFIGRNIAPYVKELHCVDLSPDFLDFCRRELEEFSNVHCHLIKYADISALKGSGINRVYSTAVWIHFNYYDFFHYLTALNGILDSGATLYFDYLDPEGIKDGDGKVFSDHAEGYLRNRNEIFNLVQYNSEAAVKEVLRSTGLRLVARWQTHEDCYSILAEKL